MSELKHKQFKTLYGVCAFLGIRAFLGCVQMSELNAERLNYSYGVCVF